MRAFSVLQRFAGGAAVVLLALSASLIGASPARAVSHALIQGTGSTWSANAVNQWVSDVGANGLQVIYTGSGSAQGRTDFANSVTDFAVSDIGYQGVDPVTGAQDTNCIPGQPCRQFAYEPIVAGGTSFPYHVEVGGQLVRNLRLSGATLAKIFTYAITNWDDPAITADNNGHQLPSIPIVPVVHSEGSGSTAQFSAYLNDQFPSIWQPFVHANGPTEYWPPPSNGQGIAQSGSDGVMNFVASSAANGAIGYDEYSYPLQRGWPVAKIENKAGFFTLPDQYNVAVALTKAQINTDKTSQDYLLEQLHDVYVAGDPRVYPLSSYSYMLIPTASNDSRMTTAKRQTLADFLYYSVCTGQKEMGPIGYSPLPINLVQASFSQTAKLKAADPGVDLTQRDVSTCQNPTFVAGHPKDNHLADIAPYPQSCDKLGAGPCTTDNTGAGPSPSVLPPHPTNPGPSGNPIGDPSGGSNPGGSTGPPGGKNPTGQANPTGGTNSTGGTTDGANPTGGVNPTGGTNPTGGVNPTGGTNPIGGTVPTSTGSGGSTSGLPVSVTSSGGVYVNPDTGVTSTTGTTSDGSSPPIGTPVDVASRQPDMTPLYGTVAVLGLLAVLFAPPTVSYVLRRRRGKP